MNYSETLEFLFSQLPAYHRIGKAAYKNNLDNTFRLDEHLGHPHQKFRTIHIAGTNGKGSVSHMTASVLQEAGYKTGLYTSPHLRDFRERIKVNGEMIPENEVIGFISRNKAVIEEIKPSFFEMTVAMAFDYFAREKVDIAVIEVGLGGRLDSTNIVDPVLSVITNIGHDHMDILGDTLEKVAAEKAGIIKEGVPVVIGESQVESAGVFFARADSMHSVISFADNEFSCRLGDDPLVTGERKFRATDKDRGKILEGITVLGGDYQSKNLMTVFATFRSLENLLDITEENLLNGIRNVIKNTGLEGRWQVLSRKPLIICDTGHNKEGLEYVTRQLRKLDAKRLHMVIGFVNDKDLSAVLPLFPANATYYFTKASVSRALDENILREKAADYELKGSSYPDVKTALNTAKINSTIEDVIFIGGSTFVVADCLSAHEQL
ncbi:MAG TPA: folylpolyglutamate synthase/dihydrofolate synthase family protein [Bacteroidales bacterium]|nr:folylpolyglutamate synthase/dihydrofolate synthase family protein [Bacteroidales bacterium]